MLQRAMHGYADRSLWATNLPIIGLFDRLREAIRRETGTERWYKLAVVAQASLQRDTTATGEPVHNWLESRGPSLGDAAAQYCLHDALLTRHLFRAATTSGLICPPRSERGCCPMLMARSLTSSVSVIATRNRGVPMVQAVGKIAVRLGSARYRSAWCCAGAGMPHRGLTIHRTAQRNRRADMPSIAASLWRAMDDPPLPPHTQPLVVQCQHRGGSRSMGEAGMPAIAGFMPLSASAPTAIYCVVGFIFVESLQRRREP